MSNRIVLRNFWYYSIVYIESRVFVDQFYIEFDRADVFAISIVDHKRLQSIVSLSYQ